MTIGDTGAPGGLAYAYNTNGLLAHRAEDILDLLHHYGYSGIALTLDHCHLDPFAADYRSNAARFRQAAEQRELRIVVETGSRYLLDPIRKHWPTLVSHNSEARAQRIALMRRAIEIASELHAEAVCFWSGSPETGSTLVEVWDVFHSSVDHLLGHAVAAGVHLALEPEPTMLVETLDDAWLALREHPALMCALDVGHCLVTQEMEPPEAIESMRERLASVTVEDMRLGVHEHLPFGEGDLDLPAVIETLARVEFAGLVTVELSRDSHRGSQMVKAAIRALRSAESSRRPRGG